MYLPLKEKHKKVIKRFMRMQKVVFRATMNEEKALDTIFDQVDKMMDLTKEQIKEEIARRQPQLFKK